MNGKKLVDAVKEKLNLESSYALSKLLGVERQKVYLWETRSVPDGVSTLKLAELAGLSPSQALEKIQGGYATLSIMAMTAVMSTALLLSHPLVENILYYVKLLVYRK